VICVSYTSFIQRQVFFIVIANPVMANIVGTLFPCLTAIQKTFKVVFKFRRMVLFRAEVPNLGYIYP